MAVPWTTISNLSALSFWLFFNKIWHSCAIRSRRAITNSRNVDVVGLGVTVSEPDHTVRKFRFSPLIKLVEGLSSSSFHFLVPKYVAARGRNWEQEKKDEFEIAPGTRIINTSSSPSPRDATLALLPSLTTCSLLPKSIFGTCFCSSSSSWVDNNGFLHRQATRSRAWTFANYESAASLMATFRPPMCGACVTMGVPSNFFSLLKRRYQISVDMVVADEKSLQ